MKINLTIVLLFLSSFVFSQPPGVNFGGRGANASQHQEQRPQQREVEESERPCKQRDD